MVKKILYVIFTIVIVLLFLKFIFYIYEVNLRYIKYNSGRIESAKWFSCFTHDGKRFVGRTNFSEIINESHVNNGPDGFRGERSLNTMMNSPGNKIIFLGDSSTYGYGVDDELIFSQRVEKQLNNISGNKWTSVNLGIPGHKTHEGIYFLKNLVPKFKPEIAVVSYAINDGFRKVYLMQEDGNYNNISSFKWFVDNICNFFIPRESLTYWRLLDSYARLKYYLYLKGKKDLINLSRYTSEDDYKKNLKTIIGMVDTLNAKLIFLLIPIPLDLYPAKKYSADRGMYNKIVEYYNQGKESWNKGDKEKAHYWLLKAAREDGISNRDGSVIYSDILVKIAKEFNVTVVDLRQLFWDLEYKGEDIFFDHNHPNAYGHKLLADAIIKKIKEATAY